MTTALPGPLQEVPMAERPLDRYQLPFEVAAQAAREVTEDLGAFQEDGECDYRAV